LHLIIDDIGWGENGPDEGVTVSQYPEALRRLLETFKGRLLTLRVRGWDVDRQGAGRV
jgi:hypothetical protein